MKHILINFMLASLLTFPVYVGLANTPVVNDWFLYGRAWDLFQPLFDLGHAFGIERQAAIVIGTMFAVSFALALTGIVVLSRTARGLFA
jgi:hypothetical protein